MVATNILPYYQYDSGNNGSTGAGDRSNSLLPPLDKWADNYNNTSSSKLVSSKNNKNARKRRTPIMFDNQGKEIITVQAENIPSASNQCSHSHPQQENKKNKRKNKKNKFFQKSKFLFDV